MPVHDFQVPVSGWVRDLSPKARDQIRKEVPQVPVERVASAVVNYCLRRDAAKEHPRPEPNKIRAQLMDLAEDARRMHDALESPSFSTVEWLCREIAAVHAASPTFCNDLRTTLGTAAKVFERAAERVPPGPWRTPGERLVRELIAILQDARLTVDTRLSGSLCLLLDIIANDVGENSAGFVKMAKRLLERRDRPGRK